MNLYGFAGNDGVDWVDVLGECIGKITVEFDQSIKLTKNADKNITDRDGNIIRVLRDYWKTSGYQFIGTMNVFDEAGNLLGAYLVRSGGHREPHRDPDHDTTIPSGNYFFGTTLVGSVPGFLVERVPGRGDIQIHRDGVTTGCIAVTGFDDLAAMIEGTRDDTCCTNRRRIPLHVWYNMKDGAAKPMGNRFRTKKKAGQPLTDDPDPDIHPPTPMPISVPRAIPVPIENDPKPPARNPFQWLRNIFR